jgi:GNAT superfamily N-acetyltransferase
MKVTIRKATIKDKVILETLMVLLNKTRDSLFSKKTIAFHKHAKDNKVFLQKKDFLKSIMFVAEVDQEIIGYCFGSLHKRKNTLLSNMGYIDEVFVKDSMRKFGVAKKLFTELVREFKRKGCDHMITHTDFENKLAQDFYDSIGMHKATLEYWKKL